MIYTKDLVEFCQNQKEKAAEIIKKTRKKKGLTTYRLAKLAGMEVHTIERIERGENVYSDNLYKVMMCLKIKNILIEDLN